MNTNEMKEMYKSNANSKMLELGLSTDKEQLAFIAGAEFGAEQVFNLTEEMRNNGS